MSRLFRLLKIFGIALRFGLHEFVPGLSGSWFFRIASGHRGEPKAQRLREALETLGPIFVKFGQVLSTRRDLLPLDIADELAKLQDRVPPFPSERGHRRDRAIARQPGRRGFRSIRAAAGGERFGRAGAPRDAARRPRGGGQGAAPRRRSRRSPRTWRCSRRPPALIERLLGGRPAAASRARWWRSSRATSTTSSISCARRRNASQLRRNFEASPLLVVPEVYWDCCAQRVMVMERMHGTPISQVQTLRAQGVDIPALARTGVEIFFTQVFRDGFFHADMHPGNILVARRRAATSRSTSASWAR